MVESAGDRISTKTGRIRQVCGEVLVEVVSQVSSAHKERTDIRQIKDAFTDLLRSMDKDEDGTITRGEYNSLVDTLEKINANQQNPGPLGDDFFILNSLGSSLRIPSALLCSA